MVLRVTVSGMDAQARHRPVTLTRRTSGRNRTEAVTPVRPNTSVAASVWPADLAGLERIHKPRWHITHDPRGGYLARRWIDNGEPHEPVIPRFEVWNASAAGLHAARTAIGDLT